MISLPLVWTMEVYLHQSRIRDDYYERDPETGEDKLRKCRALGWVRTELDAWLLKRIAARDAKRDKMTKPKTGGMK